MFRKCLSYLIILSFITCLAPAASQKVQAASESIKVNYAINNVDFALPLSGSWDTGGAVVRQDYVVMQPNGGVIWQVIPVTNNASGPSVGDQVYASVKVTLNTDVIANSNVLVRINDGASELAEINDLTDVPRGKQVELTTIPLTYNGIIPSNKSSITIEMHNDSQGIIELHEVKLWGIKSDGVTRIEYPLLNGTFAAPLNNATDWGSGKVERHSALLMNPGSAAWRSVALGNQADQPQPDDKLSLSLDIQVEPDTTATTSLIAKVNDGANSLIEINDLSTITKGKWVSVEGIVVTATPKVPTGITQLWIELHNDTNAPIRITHLKIQGERVNHSYDLNGDGSTDTLDLAFLQDQIAIGQINAAIDYDRDGELTDKDADFFKKFALNDPTEIYANMDHFNYLNEQVTIAGKAMFITHLYAEPLNPLDLGQGYKRIGDVQEGISAVDDVARAVLVYVEHYSTYNDAFSYDMMKRGLQFVMWMQLPNGDFDNFVDRDSEGVFYKKASHSSTSDFSYWAARGYEAMASALPYLKSSDSDLAELINTKLLLCLNRIQTKISSNYGQYTMVGTKAVPKWNLLDDSWLSSIAISAIAKHLEATENTEVEAKAIQLIQMLGEALIQTQAGDYTTFPFYGFMHQIGSDAHTWDEWGSIQIKAMALAGKLTGHLEWVQAAEEAGNSFASDLLISGRAFHLSPNKRKFPEINYGTASYIENYLTLYDITGLEKYAVMAGVAASWWMGNNSLHLPMFNQQYGLAFDGIDSNGANINSGGESVDEALRAILRLKKADIAARYMLSDKSEELQNHVIEAEELYSQNAPADLEMNVPNSGLNDPAQAIITQNNPPQLDEKLIYEDSLLISVEKPIYTNWLGQSALFIAASGYNNARIFNNGYIYNEVAVGGIGQFQIGDNVKLDFAARLEFDTKLTAEVLAVNAAGQATLLANANTMKYSSRTWYAGNNSVKTTPVSFIPQGTVKLQLKFSNTSVNPKPEEGYVAITQVKLFKVSVPEIRYGSTDLSGGSYVEMPPQQKRNFDVTVAKSGEYDIYLSAINHPSEQAATLAIGFNDVLLNDKALVGAEKEIGISYLGRIQLTEGMNHFTMENKSPAFAAEIDAITVAPVEAYAIYQETDGTSRKIIRDSWSRTLYTGTLADLALRHRIRLDAAKSYVQGENIALTGTIIDEAGQKVANEPVTIKFAEATAQGTTNLAGQFTVDMLVPKSLNVGKHLIEAESKTGNGSLLLDILKKPADNTDQEVTPTPTPKPTVGTTPTAVVIDPVLPIMELNIPANEQHMGVGSLQADENGIAFVELDEGKTELVLNGDLSNSAISSLKIGTKDTTLTIPLSIIQNGLASFGQELQKAAKVTVRIEKRNREQILDLINKMPISEASSFTISGDVYDFGINVAVPGKDSIQIQTFTKPVQVEFKLHAAANKQLAGVYYFDNTGSLEFIPNQLQGNQLKVMIVHFSSYGILEYDKHYMDVTGNDPAYAAIRALSAQHVVQGVDLNHFQPERALTRAEFVKMVVKAFNLPTAKATHTFDDVKAESWYAPYVATLFQTGIVRGRTSHTFDPTGLIKAGEMDLIIKSLEKHYSLMDSTKDYMLGYKSNQAMTRANSASVLYSFLEDKQQALN